MENSHINESILSEEILEDQKKNRIDHMTYLPGMEDIGSDVMDQVISAMNAYDYEKYTEADVRRAIAHDIRTPEDFAALLSPAALPLLEEIAQAAQAETRKHFGNSVYMFTPIYIANYCENYCIYCGFNCHNKIHRAKLNMEEIEKILLQLSEKVAGRLRKGKQMAKTVAVEVKYNDFIKASRQTTLDRCTDSGTEIYQLSKELFRELWEKDGNKSVRLLGIRTANLEEQGALEQMSIMDIMAQTTNKQQNATTNISREKMKKLDKALDAIKNKYGEDKIKRASLLAEQTVDMKNKKYYEE